MKLEDFKSTFRDIVYSALQKHAEELEKAYVWGAFVNSMNSVAKDVESTLRSMGGEASCETGLIIANPRLAHKTESYGKAFISCSIRKPGEKEKLVTAYIPMAVEVMLKRHRASVIVFGIGEKEDIEVK